MKARAARTARCLPWLFVAGCAVAPDLPPWPTTHPASPDAEAAPEAAPSTTLRLPVRTPVAADAPAGGGHGR